ncbi:alpha/beta hydrolase [Amycolatopsis saalfeldensis]|uniref:TAP-like protein n=1 Tax=Amycolatopsis saalfeldensis TaxID=394193 RepID=A0A1H8YJ28_9PSEU|nr:alpha/beta hydrolase [Amycolatopsis saalfeldensis]SEP52214.1 TAP-like protein [Amycolatopsis saalfeldensis]
MWSGTAVGRQVLGAYDLIGFDGRGIGHSPTIHYGLSEADRGFGAGEAGRGRLGGQRRGVPPYVNTANIWACAFWPRDAVTAYSDALRMRTALGGRRADPVDDVGHGVDLTKPCTAARLTDFLLHNQLPTNDAACGATP